VAAGEADDLWAGADALAATSMIVALAARSLPGRLRAETRLVIGLAIVGSGIANAALGRIAVESVPHDRVGMGSGANNTARYLGGAAGVALVVTIGSGAGPDGLIQGWNTAALVSAGLCAAGAVVVASCRDFRST
jgi:hypothetical protein